MKNGFYINQNERVIEARNMMLNSSPFYASILLCLKLKEQDSGTFCVSSTELKYNPEFAKTLSMANISVILEHEILHLTLRHHLRGSHIPNYNHNDWNIAADLAINSTLFYKDGFPKEALVPGIGEYRKFPMGLSAEEYYAMLQKQKEEDRQQQNDKSDESEESESDDSDSSENDSEQSQDDEEQNDNSSTTSADEESSQDDEITANVFGKFEQCEDTGEEEDKITQMVCQAIAACEEAGEELPSTIKRQLKDILPKPQIPWKAVLRNCLSMSKTVGTNWNRPSRRNTSKFIMPSHKVQQVGNVIYAVDVSESIDEEMYAQATSEIINSLSVNEKVDMWFWDTKIQATHTLTSATDLNNIEIVGGGGTKIACVFDKIKREHLNPNMLIIFSDMMFYESWQEIEKMIKETRIKVLWINQSTYRDVPTKLGKELKLNKTI